MMATLSLPLAFSLTVAAAVPQVKGKGQSDFTVEPSRAPQPIVEPEPALELEPDNVPPIPRGVTTVTFGMPQPVVGQVCTTDSDGKISLTGEPAILAAFGDERGGRGRVEVTVLEVREGKEQKLRWRNLIDEMYGAYQGKKSLIQRATRGQSYILTRTDDEGWFDATREDGTPITSEERQELRDDLDRRFPGVLDGRTMTIGRRVQFSDEELHRYFAFEDSSGMKVKSHEMKLGDINGDIARVDVKIELDVNSTNGEAGITAWATVRSDLAQRRVTETIEGPLRIELPGAVAGLGAPASPGASGPAPHVLKGTFHFESSTLCKVPKRK